MRRKLVPWAAGGLLVLVAAFVLPPLLSPAPPTPEPRATPAPGGTAAPSATATRPPAEEPGPRSYPQAFAPDSFWNARIPARIAFADGTLPVAGKPVPINPTVGRELAGYAQRPDGAGSNTWIAWDKYTSRIVVVGSDQPLVPVKLCRDPEQGCVPSWAAGLDQALRGVDEQGRSVGGGVPIPDDVVLPDADDTDASIVVYQPNYRAPNGARGRLYELWKFRRNPDFDAGRRVGPGNARYTAAWGGRMVGINGTGPGHYRDCPPAGCPGATTGTAEGPTGWGEPDSQAESRTWGPTSTSLPMLATQMTLADCRAGRMDHGLGIEVPYARAGTHFWPAQRHDGWAQDKVLSEGMRLTFPRGAKPPASLTPVGRAVWDAAYRYGLVIDDQTASSLNFRAEPGCERTRMFRRSGAARAEIMRDFPWGELRVIAEGSDEDPNPTR